MKPATCAKCPHLGDEGQCDRYNKNIGHVRGCGLANKGYNRRPFSRGGAEVLRKWYKEEKEKGT